MDTYPLLLIATEPRAYRSLLASELPFLRPNLRILEIDPVNVDATLTILHPAVIICSRAWEHIHDAGVAIVVLHTDEVGVSLQSSSGAIVNPRLSDLLSAIDRAVLASNLATLPPPHDDESR